MYTKNLSTLLSLSALLAACGGGGGGSGHLPVTSLPDLADTSAICQGEATCMTSEGGSNAQKRLELYTYAEENATTASGSKARSRAKAAAQTTESKTPSQDDISEAFEQMNTIFLSENTDWKNQSESDLRRALFLMGFKAEDLDGIADLATWCRINSLMLRPKAEQAYSQYGKEKAVSLENATLTAVNINTQTQDSYYRFMMKDGKIIGLLYDAETNSSSSRQMYFEKMADGTFKYMGGLYTVEFPLVYENEQKTMKFSLELELVQPVTSQNFAELKKRMIAKIYEKQADGKTIYPSTEYWEEYINNLQYETDFAQKIDNKDEDAVHYWESDKPVYLTYESYAKDIGETGLQYSDFGLTEATGTGATGNKIVDKAVFAGGYEIFKINKSQFNDEKMTFKGKAVATALYQNENGQLDDREETAKSYAGTAELVFDNGNEILTTDFSKDGWYTVQVQTNTDNNAKYDITFTGGNRITGDQESDFANYKFNNQETYTQSDIIGYHDLDDGARYGTVDIGYYGNNGSPTEATGYVGYGEERPDDNDGAESLHIQIGFGTTKQ